MKNEDLIKEMWSLANVITGFAVAQSVAFAIGLGTTLTQVQGYPWYTKMVLVVVIIVFTWFYCSGVSRCWKLAKKIGLETIHNSVWQTVTRGRIICIVLFSLLVIGAVLTPAPPDKTPQPMEVRVVK